MKHLRGLALIVLCACWPSFAWAVGFFGGGGSGGGLTTGDLDTCAKIAGILTDETGTCGAVVLSQAPTLASAIFTTKINAPRVTALPGSPSAGDVVVVTDDSAAGACDSAAGATVSLCYYTGAAWIGLGDGNTGGGSVATDAIWDATGDLAVGSGANTAARLAMGTANQVLKVNALGTGVEWGTDSTGGSPTFDSIATGSNTTATMTCGAGCSVVPSSTGVIAATAARPTVLTVNAGNSPYTALATDFSIRCDTSAAGRTINLPAATTKLMLVVKNIGANACTIARAGTDTIDGATSLVLQAQYVGVVLVSDGVSAWDIQ